MSHTIVIGAGFGGLAAALRARAHGDSVTLLERLPTAGGRARQRCVDGYTYDLGPTVITAPCLFDELFALFGERCADAAPLIPLDHWYRFRFQDGSVFDYGADPAAVEAQIARLSPPDVAGYQLLLAYSEALFHKGYVELGDVPFHHPARFVRTLPDLLRLRSMRSVWQAVCRFLQHPHLRRAFSIQPLLIGGSPLTTPALYLLIHALERRWGVHFPQGGTGALVEALIALFRRQGGELRTAAPVASILTEGIRVTGVRLASGEELRADRVIANADPGTVYGQLLPPGPRWHRARLRTLRYSMGVFVLYFGTTRRYPEVQHHTIGFGHSYEPLLRALFTARELPEDFSYYLHRPTATDPTLAPVGCDSFYVLVPVPHLAAGLDWNTVAESFADRILARLEQDLLPDLRRHLAHRFWQTPAGFAADYGTPFGAGFSLQPLLSQSAFGRFHNQSPLYRNLYFVGAGTHPGAGVPGVLSSARVLERIVPWPQTP